VGLHEILVVDMTTWKEIKHIPVAGQPVFAIASPDGQTVWVNFALPDNGKVQIIDVEKLEVARTLEPGKGVLHMEFTPRGDELWLSVRDENRVDVFNSRTFEKIKSLPAESPSGIFFTSRAQRLGM
jgi:protein NirF